MKWKGASRGRRQRDGKALPDVRSSTGFTVASCIGGKVCEVGWSMSMRVIKQGINPEISVVQEVEVGRGASSSTYDRLANEKKG